MSHHKPTFQEQVDCADALRLRLDDGGLQTLEMVSIMRMEDIYVFSVIVYLAWPYGTDPDIIRRWYDRYEERYTVTRTEQPLYEGGQNEIRVHGIYGINDLSYQVMSNLPIMSESESSEASKENT